MFGATVLVSFLFKVDPAMSLLLKTTDRVSGLRSPAPREST